MKLCRFMKCFAILVLLITSHSFIATAFSNANAFNDINPSTTWYVDDNGGADYTCIQDAIDNASDGDTIFVYGGIYTELINVDKSLDLVGEDKNSTVINGAGQGQPVRVWASNVSFQGFNVLNGIDDGYSAGINVYGKHVHVSDCIVQANDCGFRLTFTDDIIVDNCTIRTNSAHSIYVIVSSNVSIRDCDVYRNGDEEGSIPGGILISTDSEYATQSNIYIHNCKIHDNALCGIAIGDAWSELGYKDIYIENNNIYNNTDKGIVVWDSEVIIRYNFIHDNGYDSSTSSGIYLQECKGSVLIEQNRIISNNKFGVYLMRSYDNTIRYNNFIDNKYDAFFRYPEKSSFSNNWEGNYWDNQLLPGCKIIWGRCDLRQKSGITIILPFFNIDRHPSSDPYDIP